MTNPGHKHKGKYSNIVPLTPSAGRPTEYKEEYCWTIRDLAAEGLFPETWCAKIGVTLVTMYAWANKHPEFEEAYRISWHLLTDYWTRYAMDNLKDKNLKDPLLRTILSRRFPNIWGQNGKLTLEHFEARNDVPPEESPDPAAPRTVEERRNRIEQLLAKRAEKEK